MKIFKLLIATFIVVMLAVVGVSAATVTYDLVPYDEEENMWEVTFTYNMELDEASNEYADSVVGVYTTYFTFNPDKLVLTNTDYEVITDYSTASGTPVYFYPTKSGRNEFTYTLADAKDKTWTVLANGDVQGYLTANTQYSVFEPNGTTVLSVAFSLADGVGVEDLRAEDFVVKSVFLSDTANAVTYGYQYTNTTCDETLTVVNNVVPAPVTAKTAKLPVNAGDVVYKAGADIAPVVVDEDGTYDIVVNADTEGTYIVNTGYTAQKVYTVKADLENCFAEVADYEDGILGKSGVSVRYVTPQGIRFKGEVKDTIRNRADLVEYGFIMTAESAYNNLPENYVLDMALVGTGKAKRGVAYDKGDTDLYAEKTADSIIIAGVLHGIPKTKANVQTPIASRPYYKLEDGSYVYGEITRASIYEVAKAIYNVEGYEAAWEYAKEIIELVDGPRPVVLEKEIAIDVSSLYN